MTLFFRKNTLFLLFSSLFLLFLSHKKLLADDIIKAANKQSNKYIIENINIDVESESSAMARNLAFNEARKKAFVVLLNRLNKNDDFAADISDEEITRLVRSEQVVNEKIYKNRYRANFQIYFAKDFVDDLFLRKKEELKKTETASDLRFLLIPVKMTINKNLMWEQENNFKKYVSQSVIEQKVKNFTIISADIENLAQINAQNITSLDFDSLNYLLDKYQADIIYLNFFSYDEKMKKASILIRGFEKKHKFQYRLSFINSNNLPDDELVAKVSSKMVDYLSDLKIEEIRAQSFEKDMIKVQIPLRSLSQWLLIKERIENNKIISRLEIQSVSRDMAKIILSTDDSLNIVEIFAKMGLTIRPKSQNVYLLTSYR